MSILRTLVLFGACLVVATVVAATGGELAPVEVRDIMASFENQAAAIHDRTEVEIKAVQEEAADELQKVQDKLCREGRLDEAMAVRDQIRTLCATFVSNYPGLPPAAKEILGALEIKAARIEGRAEDEMAAVTSRAAEPLERIVHELSQAAKLTQAVAVRDQLRQIRQGVMNVRPDPGNLHAQPSDIGQAWYFEVTGSSSGSVYGTDVYTSDSTLAACAVHAGVLRAGQKGIVKVVILPGAQSYLASTRHGITSHAYGPYSVSFQVKRVYALVRGTSG